MRYIVERELNMRVWPLICMYQYFSKKKLIKTVVESNVFIYMSKDR